MSSYPSIWRPLTQMKEPPEHLKVKSAEGIYLYLESGQKVIDGISSWWVNLHGHSDPRLAEALFEQSQKLQQVIFADFTHEPAEILAERLIPLLPDPINHVFFSDNGSCSVEIALKMAFQYWVNRGETRRHKFIGFQNGYHGETIGALSVGGESVYNQLFVPLLFPVETIPFPDTFMGDSEVEEKENRSIYALESVIASAPEEFAAIIIEPLIQGAGGMNICRPEFLTKLKKVADNAEILLIFDEVMTGFGRTGKLFASDHLTISPDIICLSKGLSGGILPLAATVCTSKIFEAFYSNDFGKTFTHSHSFTANPLGCATAIASLDILEKEQKYRSIEQWHLNALQKLTDHPKINKIRVLGTIGAMDIATEEDDGYLNPIGLRLKAACLERGVFIRPLGNVVYLMPPYCITEEELSFCYDVIIEALEMESELLKSV